MRKFILLATFLIVTPIFLIFSIIFVALIHFEHIQSQFLTSVAQPQTVAYAALPTTQNSLSDQIIEQNARAEMLTQFFEQYNSPLAPYAQTIVDEADAYNLDFRLLPAIAMQESDGCLKAPPNSDNCWGFGIYGHTVTRFDSYPSAIQAVSKALAEKYASKGLKTPEQIMSIYDPPSSANGGRWADSVSYFMNKLQ